MTVPRVYAAITAIIADLSSAGIPKRHINARERYQYRSIDDVYERLSPLLAQHKLCVLPRVLKRECSERQEVGGGVLVNVRVKAAFDLVSAEDGSRHVIKCFGEALDAGDKATAKATSAAYKQAMLQAFCIPIGDDNDGDARTYQLTTVSNVVEPVQGWAAWSQDLIEILASCPTSEAIDRLQKANRGLLRAAALSNSDVYVALGDAIRVRREILKQPRAPAAHESPAEAQPKRARKRSRPSAADASG